MADIQLEMQSLVHRYERQRAILRRSDSGYSEADTRADFLDPFFRLLGWDVTNERGLSLQLREVIRETQVAVDEHAKRPDYVFKLGRERRYFVEAKTPSVDLLTDPRPAFQTRRYGWSGNLMVSVVTNFEDLVIYDTTSQPAPDQPANHSRIYKFSYREYVERYDEIAALLSREAVYSGDFDERFSQKVIKRPSESIDAVFLETLNQWRLALGRDVVEYRPDIDPQILNEVVQRFILRVLFLRMCEDRGIQTYEHLKAVAATNDWGQFVAMLQESNIRFDSELFSTEHDPLCRDNAAALRLDSATVAAIIESLYFPQAPYTFSVVEPEFLGDVYQQFLVEQLAVDEGHVALVPKPENVDRDVVPTPRPLVTRIVQETLEPLVKDTTPDEFLSLRVVDPASGSGGFLIAAYDVLINQATEAYREAGDHEAVFETANGPQLAFDRKCEILTSCVFGVDRDFLAVEVTRFGLWVKLLEQESQDTLPNRPGLLPPLETNIVSGDALVDERVYAEGPDPEMVGIPLSWGRHITCPFDVVVGNPPYLFTEAMLNLEPTEYQFYQQHYTSAHRQFDKYYLFIERALTVLLKEDGVFGMVVSRKFAQIEAGKKLRKLISDGRHLVKLVDFGTAQMFEGRTTYTCLLFLSKAGVPQPNSDEEDVFDYEVVTTPREWLQGLVDNNSNQMRLPRKLVSGDMAWLLPSTPAELELVLALLENTTPLEQMFDIFNGIQTSRNTVYVISEWEDENEELVAFTEKGRRWLIERAILKPFFDDNLGTLRSFHPMPDIARVIFPYFLEPQSDGELRARVIPPTIMKARFPHAYAWLEHNIETLRKRDIRPAPYPEDEWYRYGRDQALTVFEGRPKIVVGVNSLGDKYVYDETGTLLASGGTAGECAIAHFRDPEKHTPISLYFILALLNHKAIEYYCRKRGSPFRGGWYARGTAVLKTVPVPNIDFENPEDERVQLYAAITSTCEHLCEINTQLTEEMSARKRERLERRAGDLKRTMDEQISELYGISEVISEVELPT